MKQLVQALPFVFVLAFAANPACQDDTASDDGSGVTVTVGGPTPQACNEGAPDGYCNMQGDNPETCQCFDCVETPACTGLCNDNGTCDAGEDCTCADCYDANCVNDGAGPGPDTGQGPTTEAATTTGGTGGSGAGPSGAGGAQTNTVSTTSAGGAAGVGGAGVGGTGGI